MDNQIVAVTNMEAADAPSENNCAHQQQIKEAICEEFESKFTVGQVNTIIVKGRRILGSPFHVKIPI